MIRVPLLGARRFHGESVYQRIDGCLVRYRNACRAHRSAFHLPGHQGSCIRVGSRRPHGFKRDSGGELADHHGRQAGGRWAASKRSSDRPPLLAASVWQTAQYSCTSAFCCATGMASPAHAFGTANEFITNAEAGTAATAIVLQANAFMDAAWDLLRRECVSPSCDDYTVSHNGLRRGGIGSGNRTSPC